MCSLLISAIVNVWQFLNAQFSFVLHHCSGKTDMSIIDKSGPLWSNKINCCKIFSQEQENCVFLNPVFNFNPLRLYYVTEWCIYRATHSCCIRVASPIQAEARETIPKMLAELNLGRTEKCVRVNSVSSGLTDADLEVILQAEVLPPALMLPKVEDTEEVQWVSGEKPVLHQYSRFQRTLRGKYLQIVRSTGIR